MLVQTLPASADNSSSHDITATFEVIYLPWGTYSADDVFNDTPAETFEPLNPPVSINRFGKEAWLKTVLPVQQAKEPIAVLEIPGQIFNYVDVWFRYSKDEIDHYYAGDRYPYVSRAIKHASAAFPIRENYNGSVEVLIRARNETTHAMNFAARLWTESQWQEDLMLTRAWYGAFVGAVLVLCLYLSLIHI